MTKNSSYPFLQSDEKVLWQGRPTKPQLMEAPYSWIILFRWVCALILFYLAVRYWNFAATITVEPSVRIGTCIFLVFCGVMMAIGPFRQLNNLENNINYMITNKRVITFRKKNAEVYYTASRYFTDLSEATVLPKSNGLADLVIGPVSHGVTASGRRDIPPVEREDDALLPLMFYNIRGVEDAVDTLPSFFVLHDVSRRSGKDAA